MAGGESGVRVCSVKLMFQVVWNWFLRSVSRWKERQTDLPEQQSLPQQASASGLAEFGNAFADNSQPAGGRYRTEIDKLLPVVADGEYDLVLTDQFPVGENHAGDAAARDPAEDPLALLLALGAVIGLQRQIDALQEPETDVVLDADEDERRLLALLSDAGLPRVATVTLGVHTGGLQSNLEAENTQGTQKTKSRLE